ncbi:hypothetical protein [Flavobacterium hercynium]|uniref:Uncharacterized protein n=1 Tax=Flavobacterium hercynium TaxID=387094 RepID=A0A226HPD7_9FLAO|nr:hypothetical protein [Flavobacterium hercynium]OXA95758.1 hypothetical protein B0A66_02065 [Flavobacterium hercynium]SMP16380.1 hypothetical protein SAMN06265346_10525 [Flavobacterium hercynium]
MKLEDAVSILSTQEETRLIEFFNKKIEAKVMAKMIRKLNFIVALGIMREDETLQLEIENVEDGYFWLNELAEVLDPYFESDTI